MGHTVTLEAVSSSTIYGKRGYGQTYEVVQVMSEPQAAQVKGGTAPPPVAPKPVPLTASEPGPVPMPASDPLSE